MPIPAMQMLQATGAGNDEPWIDHFNYTDGSTLADTADWTEYDATWTIYNPSANNTGKVYTFGTGQARRLSGTGVNCKITSNLQLYYPGTDMRSGIIVGFLDATHYLMWEININATPGENKIGLYLRHGVALYDHIYEDLTRSWASLDDVKLALSLKGLEVKAWVDDVLLVSSTLTTTQRGYLGDDVGMITEIGASSFLDFQAEVPL